MLNTTSSTTSSDPLTAWIHNLTNTISNEINDDLHSFAQSLGVHDFYSAHILDYCEGYYTPTALPNASFPLHSIHKNITSCSNRTAFYHFNPTASLQRELNASGHGYINLTSSLHWPAAVKDGLDALKVAQRAAFLLYCIAIGLIAAATLVASVSVVLAGRLSACIDLLVTGLAFLSTALASAITTAVAVKAEHVVNKHGTQVGVSAKKGKGFLVLTWLATLLMFLSLIVWGVVCVVGRRKKASTSKYVDGERK